MKLMVAGTTVMKGQGTFGELCYPTRGFAKPDVSFHGTDGNFPLQACILKKTLHRLQFHYVRIARRRGLRHNGCGRVQCPAFHTWRRATRPVRLLMAKVILPERISVVVYVGSPDDGVDVVSSLHRLRERFDHQRSDALTDDFLVGRVGVGIAGSR